MQSAVGKLRQSPPRPVCSASAGPPGGKAGWGEPPGRRNGGRAYWASRVEPWERETSGVRRLVGSLGAGEHPRGVHRPLPALPAVPPPPIPRPIPARGGTSQKRHQASRAARGGTAQPFPPPGAQKSRTVRLPRGRQRPRKGSEALRRLRVRHPLPPGDRKSVV